MLESERIINIIEIIDEKTLLLEAKIDLMGIENIPESDKMRLKKLRIEKKRLLNEYEEAKFNEYLVEYNREIILRRAKIYKRRKKDKEV